MIESIEFTNFKALRQTTLPLAPFTLLLGPNGSGKSTVLQALRLVALIASQPDRGEAALAQDIGIDRAALLSVIASGRDEPVQVRVRMSLMKKIDFTFRWVGEPPRIVRSVVAVDSNASVSVEDVAASFEWLARLQVFALDSSAIARPFAVNSGPLQSNGAGLAAVLDDLKDNHPERWAALLAEMCRWLPEYDYILFDKPQPGQKGIVLRTKRGGHRIPATELSQGTLVALALLTLAYLPHPPSLIGLEEIDRGLHPRLLRHLQDALYRLSYPESCGEKRRPIQVIATTHSPYLLDLYRDHPEEVVLARKEGLDVEMKRLTDIAHYEEILGDSPLSEVWYSGVLGGVSVKP